MSIFLFILVGVSLGLTGTGAGIFIIPTLVYLENMSVLLATTYSLGIVSITAFFGALRYRKDIKWKTAIFFSMPFLLGIWFMRYFIMPLLPHQIGMVSIDRIIMTILILMMFMSAYTMINYKTFGKNTLQPVSQKALAAIMLINIPVGMLMGLVGIGGGFIITPFLFIVLGLPVYKALATSLCMITFNSMIAFLSDNTPLYWVDYQKLGVFSACSLLGMWIGTHYSHQISANSLKKGCGWFILCVSLLIVIREYLYVFIIG